MKVSEYAIGQIAEKVKDIQTGKRWVRFFCSLGARDVYVDREGLPYLDNRADRRPTKEEYIISRMMNMNNTENLREAIARIALLDGTYPEFLNEILRPEHYALEEHDGLWVVVGGVVNHTMPVVNQAHFQQIQRQILDALTEARVSIWVAIAWLTNETLANKLKEKYEEGLDVKVAYYDDPTNRRHRPDLGEITLFPLRAQRGGTMHDKFCVIDNQRVITGSYNWSDNAEYRNDENISIQNDPESATRYSLEFRRLTGAR